MMEHPGFLFANSTPRGSAVASVGIARQNWWWRGNWWRVIPSAVPFASSIGPFSS
ncbi:MAG: hypothetical protein LIP77_01795 [Planctomycetes bacterium]|nr:hypothetical protein [Planctomycetota bacterium]